MTDSSTWTSSPEAPAPAGVKRSATAAGNAPVTSFRAVKRRASKACQCCRARKVRCNVVEHGAPCTNCRLDEVECIITESKRRKKFWGAKSEQQKDSGGESQNSTTGNNAPRRKVSIANSVGPLSTTPEIVTLDNESLDRGSHVPHFLYQQAQSHLGEELLEMRRASYATSNASVPSLAYSSSDPPSTASSFPHIPHRSRAFGLPYFIKPTPSRIPIEDLEFLAKKGALQLPEENLRNELLRAHFKFVHPFMPLLDRKEFMEITTGRDTSDRKIGLLLFQAVMFAGSAFVDMDLLRAAGYPTRKAARKAFFTKARLLYDFDHEPDRMSLVQALLLMTYWYETPDDQKDTWHWMGVAISLSHTIGLHRNPEKSMALDDKRKKLWKRIWWSCVVRDRLVALGMRRPTRIKSEDCDVPMLALEDFDIDMDVGNIPLLCEEGESREEAYNRQRELSVMCIEKARLCVCISQVLSAQYSVLNTNQGSLAADGSTKTTMVLLPKGSDKDNCEVQKCDTALQTWLDELPSEAVYRPVRSDCGQQTDVVLGLHRNLLHMVYFTTVSALHRPQVLPSAPAPWPARNVNAALGETSRRKVRQAATEITRLATELIDLNLVRYLPTFGVTVMLPAIIIHLLDIKSSNPATRERSVDGFAVCMQVMQGLRTSYASADYATHFLEAAIKKADIHVSHTRRWRIPEQQPGQAHNISPASQRVRRRRASKTTIRPASRTLTPPPDYISIPEHHSMEMTTGDDYHDDENDNENLFLDPPSYINPTTTDPTDTTSTTLQFKLESFLATTPPPPPPQSFITSTPEAHDDADVPSITIPTGTDDDEFYPPTNPADSPALFTLDLGLGRDLDPFLGHGQFDDSESWFTSGGDDFLLGGGGSSGMGGMDGGLGEGGLGGGMGLGLGMGEGMGEGLGVGVFGGVFAGENGGWMDLDVDVDVEMEGVGVARLLDADEGQREGDAEAREIDQGDERERDGGGTEREGVV